MLLGNIMPLRPNPFRVTLGLLACAHLLGACQRQNPPPPPTPTVVQSESTLAPLAPPVIDRAELLQALDLAASASAVGKSIAEGDDLVNRRFVIRLAFGCHGPSDASTPGLARWSRGPDKRSIEITLTPADWTNYPFFSGPDSPWEAAEGFWIARPWMRESGCPLDPAAGTLDAASPAAAAPPVSASPEPAEAAPMSEIERPVMGLAAVFEEGGSRLGRRDGRPFLFTLWADEGFSLPAPTRGYRLVIEGRLTAFPEGRSIRCRALAYDARPLCMAAAEVDRVAFEEADGKLLREWRPG